MPKVLQMIDRILICPRLANDLSEYEHANVLQIIYWNFNTPKSCEGLIGVLICSGFVND